MSKRKPTWIEALFKGITKALITTVVLVTMTFVLISGNIEFAVSFNKQKSSPASLLEKAGSAIALVKTGYKTASEVLR